MLHCCCLVAMVVIVVALQLGAGVVITGVVVASSMLRVLQVVMVSGELSGSVLLTFCVDSGRVVSSSLYAGDWGGRCYHHCMLKMGVIIIVLPWRCCHHCHCCPVGGLVLSLLDSWLHH